MAFKYEINGQVVEFDKEPSESDIDEAATQLGGKAETKEPSMGLTQATFAPTPSGKSPLTTGQEIKYSTAGYDKDLQFKFLKQMLPDSEISVDEDGDFMVDGSRVNPQGFDLGDITRNLSGIIPILTQVGGSLAGASAGTVGATPGAGTVVGAMAGGTAGAAAGRALQLSLANAFGLNTSGREYLEAIVDDTKAALAGEVIGAGAVGAGGVLRSGITKLGQTKAAKGASDMWTKVIGKMKASAPNALEYISTVKGDVTKYVTGQTDNFGQRISEVLDEKYFDPAFANKMAERTLFGRNYDNLPDAFTKSGKESSMALRDLMKRTIDNKNNRGYRELMKFLSNGELDDEVLDAVSNNTYSSLFSAKNVSENRGIELAKRFVETVQGERKVLGQAIGEAREKALDTAQGKLPIALGKTYAQLQGFMDDWTKPLGKGGAKGLPGVFKNIDGILNRSLPKSSVTGRRVINRGQMFSVKQAMQLDNVLDETIETMIGNKNIPKDRMGALLGIRRELSDTIDKQLGLTETNSVFKEYMDIIDEYKLTRKMNLGSLEDSFRTLHRQNQFTKQGLETVLQATKGKGGLKLLSDIQDYNVMQRLKEFDAAKGTQRMTAGFVNDINNGGFLTGGDVQKERFYRDISNMMSGNVPKNGFMKDILNFQASQHFNKTGVNVLRVGSILGLAGFGLGGPLGGAAALTLAANLTPSAVGKGLRSFDRLAAKKLVQKAGQQSSKAAANAKTQALLRAILGKAVLANNQ